MSKAYDAITTAILALLEKGEIPWKRPWNWIKARGLRPQNFVTQHGYRGINFFLLQMLPFELPLFLTFQQAQAEGAHVRKGAKGLPVIFFKSLQKEDADGQIQEIPMARYWTVFNVADTEGMEIPASYRSDNLPVFDPIQEAERILAAMPNKPTILHGYRRAFYRPATDEICLPSREAFSSPANYYETLFHEIGHSSGHVSRLSRKEIVEAKSSTEDLESYSLEELVAEFTAAYLCAEAGIDQTLENHAAYIQGWSSRLGQNTHWLITAAARAQKAADYLLNRQESQLAGAEMAS